MCTIHFLWFLVAICLTSLYFKFFPFSRLFCTISTSVMSIVIQLIQILFLQVCQLRFGLGLYCNSIILTTLRWKSMILYQRPEEMRNVNCCWTKLIMVYTSMWGKHKKTPLPFNQRKCLVSLFFESRVNEFSTSNVFMTTTRGNM